MTAQQHVSGVGSWRAIKRLDDSGHILPWQNLLHAGEENLFSGLTALSAEFTIGEGELMAHDVPLGCAPDEYDDLISGTCSHLPKGKTHDVLTGSDDGRHSNTSLAWGAGVQFNPTESVAIDIAYEGPGSGDWRTDGFIVGVGYKF